MSFYKIDRSNIEDQVSEILHATLNYLEAYADYKEGTISIDKLKSYRSDFDWYLENIDSYVNSVEDDIDKIYDEGNSYD